MERTLSAPLTAAGLRDRVAGLLNAAVRNVRPIAGGDLSEVVVIELDDGRDVVAKGGPKPATEAGMLEAIRATGAPAPAVLAFDDTVLVLERLPGGGSPDGAWGDLGAVLARLHRGIDRGGAESRTPQFGWHVDYAFGRVAIDNTPARRWTDFWAERRLANQLSHVPAALASRVEALASDLDNRLPRAPDAALLHGDLWTGNILVGDGWVTGLIDPACYHGDREVDFAMLRLFGGPGRELFDRYGALDPGSEERLPIYQLWPALVHLRLFGAGYRPLVERLLAAAGV